MTGPLFAGRETCGYHWRARDGEEHDCDVRHDPALQDGAHNLYHKCGSCGKYHVVYAPK